VNPSSKLLLSTAYLPPFEYFVFLCKYKDITIEHHETYPKQSYRNRCLIGSPDGKLALTIPVNKPNGNHTLTKDITISYKENWQSKHWRAIESAYNNSPFFLYFKELFVPFYKKKYKYLIDFNYEQLLVISDILKLCIKIDVSEKYEKMPAKVIDLRNKIHPKRASLINFDDANLYTQVFQDSAGFLSNLSIIDLIFNEGNHSKELLLNTIIK
jgi:hypothetical protein